MLKAGIKKIAWAVGIALMAILAVFVFSVWGLVGSLALLAVWLLLYIGSMFVMRRNQQKLRNMFAKMSEEQRQATLAALSESDRAEVLEALKTRERS